MNAKLSILLAAAFILLTSCERFKRKKVELPPPATTFADDTFRSVTPTADGGAYADGYDTGVWYVHGAQAAKVQFPSPAPDFSQIGARLHITPLLDGGAYATSRFDKSVWYLRGALAQPVRQVNSLSAAPVVAPLNAFPLYITEREQRLKAERELEDRPDPNNRPEPEE